MIIAMLIYDVSLSGIIPRSLPEQPVTVDLKFMKYILKWFSRKIASSTTLTVIAISKIDGGFHTKHLFDVMRLCHYFLSELFALYIYFLLRKVFKWYWFCYLAVIFVWDSSPPIHKVQRSMVIWCQFTKFEEWLSWLRSTGFAPI